MCKPPYSGDAHQGDSDMADMKGQKAWHHKTDSFSFDSLLNGREDFEEITFVQNVEGLRKSRH